METILRVFLEWLLSLLVICGAVFTLGGAVGLVRFPDAYCRMHSLSKSSTMGIVSFMLAALVYFSWSGLGFCGKTILSLLFIFLTAPVGAHMVAKASYHYGVPLSKGWVKDDLLKECKYIRKDNADQ